MKRNILSLSIIMLSLASCQNKSNIDLLNIQGTKDENIKELAKHTLLGFSSFNNFSTMNKRNLNEEEILDVKNALYEIDILLNQDNKLVVQEDESDKEGYINKINLSFSMLDKNENFVLYYNDVNIHEEQDHDDFDEKEKNIFFKGIAIYNDNEFDFSFEIEEEEELNEKESESSFKLFFDKMNYINIKQGFEEEFDETESYYSYSLIQNGKKIEEYKFKEEIENGHNHIELIKNNKRYKINYETINNEEVLKVSLKDGKEEKAVGYFKRIVNDDSSFMYEYLEL